MSSRWVFHIPVERVDGETRTGAAIHLLPLPQHSLFATSDPAEAEFLRSVPRSVLVDYRTDSAPTPKLALESRKP